jgi:hypothetical protein
VKDRFINGLPADGGVWSRMRRVSGSHSQLVQERKWSNGLKGLLHRSMMINYYFSNF